MGEKIILIRNKKPGMQAQCTRRRINGLILDNDLFMVYQTADLLLQRLIAGNDKIGLSGGKGRGQYFALWFYCCCKTNI